MFDKMVIVREISKSLYISAFFITLSVFLMGFLLGFILNREREQKLQGVVDLENLRYESLQVQSLYLGELANEENCLGLMRTLDESTIELDAMGEKLDSYKKDTIADRENFELLKRRYILTEVRYWLLTQKTKKICKQDTILLLFFYSDKDKNSDVQGTILTYFKEKLGKELLVFSIDADFEQESIVTILKGTYGVIETPTLVINNKKYEFLTRDELTKIFCLGYGKCLDGKNAL